MFISVFFRFQFSKSFFSSVIFSSLLLFTPLLVCFSVNQPHCHRFFSVFRVYKLLVLICARLNWQILSVFECNLSYHIVSYFKISYAAAATAAAAAAAADDDDDDDGVDDDNVAQHRGKPISRYFERRYIIDSQSTTRSQLC